MLNKENYYSPEMNERYWSASLIKDFLDCEARALATLRGEYVRPSSTALLVGSYVDAHFEGPEASAEFVQNHPEIFNSRTGALKADYAKADEMIARAEADEVFKEYLTGEKQTIMTGKIFGFDFKAKFDVYLPGKRIVDLKTVKDLKPLYKEGEGRLDPIAYWSWSLQASIYQAIEGNHLPFYLAIITKEDPPVTHLFQIDQRVLDAELEYLKMKLPRFDAIRQGIIEPKRCEDCAFCRETSKVTEPVLYTGDFKEEVIHE